MSLSDLHQLRTAWEAAYPDQAKGGETALQGFAFQFAQVLLDSVRAWLAAGEVERGNPRVYAEYLSDIAELKESGLLLVTQVKLTQSSGMVIGALDDLYRIYRVAEAHVPQLLPKLEMRILSARPQLKSVDTTIANWRSNADGDNESSLKAFKARVRTEICGDPQDELLALLANELQVQSPLSILRKWLGHLIEASAEDYGYTLAAREVWSDLVSFDIDRKKKDALPIYVWTGADRQPEDVRPGRVLIGQQPQVRHLRDGYFAPRLGLSGSIAGKIASWAMQDRMHPDDALRLPLYWIGGRSGAGKSVVMLQVLAHLHESGEFAVLFPSGVSQLPAAIRWSKEVRREGRRAIIALDDPYAPVTQADAGALWRDALEELHVARQNGDASAMPLVVCCGPTEQAERLQEDMPDDIDLVVKPIPHEDVQDLSSLRQWYIERTGEDPPPVGDVNVLLVQLFFEWRVGKSLPEFARRFRHRIERVDPSGHVLHALARVLALNRIYVGACRAAIESGLSPSLLDILDRLRAEEHLVDEMGHGRPGMWLSHPHLADAIYSSWFPATAANVRRDHLKVACLGALAHGTTPTERTAPIWAIARVLGARAVDGDIATRLDPAMAGRVLSDIYALFRHESASLPLSMLPVWIRVRRLVPDLLWVPDPLEEAIARLGAATSDDQGLRLVCHMVLESTQARDTALHRRAAESVIQLLERNPGWYEWPAVANHALMCFDIGKFWSLVAVWIERNLPSKSAQQLLLRALRVSQNESRFVSVALPQLSAVGMTDFQVRIASILLSSADPTARAGAFSWVEAHRENVGAAPLLEILFKQQFAGAREWGLAWCRRWRLHESADRILQSLCVEDVGDEVVGLACAWIEQGHERSGFLMERLLRCVGRDAEVREFGVIWLRLNPAVSGEWGHVWEALWDCEVGSEATASLGRQWLREAPQVHGAWGFVWEALWKKTPGDASLTALAMGWLGSAPANHGSWQYVWKPLWDEKQGDVSLTALAMGWLRSAPADHGSWKYVWESLWKETPGDVSLTALAVEWLGSAPADHGSWGFVWLALWKETPGDASLKALATAWLRSVSPEHGSWGFVWLALWKETPEDVSLTALAMGWLRSAPADHGSWQYVWKPLWEIRQGDAGLTLLATNWLGVAQQHHSWRYVWSALWAYRAGNDLLVELAREWLSIVPVGHKGRTIVAEFLAHHPG